MKRPVVAALTPEQARRSPANRLAPALDNVRAAVARIGLRPYRVFLVWTYSTGDARGEAVEREFRRLELLPQPKLDGLDGQQRQLTSAGVNINGNVSVSHISVDLYDYDLLVGNTIPAPFQLLKQEPDFPGTFDFYYEVYEDGRTAPPLSCIVRGVGAVADPFVPGRTKWRLATLPERRAFQFRLSLERIDEEPTREGLSRLMDHDVEMPLNLPEDC